MMVLWLVFDMALRRHVGPKHNLEIHIDSLEEPCKVIRCNKILIEQIIPVHFQYNEIKNTNTIMSLKMHI